MIAQTFIARTLWLFLMVLAAAQYADAHVMLDHPNGGETLAGGSTAVIEWHVVVSHATTNWDLWYSVTGQGGPWIEIAADLPAGDITNGAVHTHDWVVPNSESDQVRVRVRQDNIGTDYEDVSDGDLEITTYLFADGFESGGTVNWSSVVP